MAALGGCKAGTPRSAPHLERVAPSQVFATEAQAVLLTGTSFTPRATLRWGGASNDVALDTAFAVFADEQRLEDVVWVDAQTLTAVAPAGLAVGKHAVRVVDPYGVATTLADALEVRVRKGAALTATLTSDVSAMRVLKGFVTHLDVTNTGDTRLTSLTVGHAGSTGTAEVDAQGVMGGATELLPGATARFELGWISRTVGDVTLGARASGVDGRSGLPVEVGPVFTGVVRIVPPPDVTSRLSAATKTVSLGQVIALNLEAQNVGQVGIKALQPVVVASPAGRVISKTVPVERDVALGASQPFGFSFDTLGVGVVSFRADALGVDAFTGAAVAMSPAFETVTIVRPPALSLTLTSSAARVAPGERVTLTATVTNSGDARALNVAASVGGAAGLTLVSAPAAAVVGATPVGFVWEYDAVANGNFQLTVSASGIDENSGLVVTASTASVDVRVERPAALATTFTTPARVNVGRLFRWKMEVSNTGDATATGVTPGLISTLSSASGALDGGPVPTQADLVGGASQAFTFGYVASDVGTLQFVAAAAGVDAFSGAAVSSAVATSAVVVVERAAALAGAWGLPSSVAASAQFTATLQVKNGGDALAVGVTPSAFAITGSATVVSGPTPASATLAADAGVDFTWVLMAGDAGTVQLTASASGVDSNDTTVVSTGPLTSTTAAVGIEAMLLAADPFGDGTAFSYVFSYRGKVWLGPRGSGFGAVSMNPDGTGPINNSFSFLKDVGTNATHKNSSVAPYPSIGSLGCVANTAACGPNNENGRGLFFSATISGVEYLGVSGAHPSSGKLEYVYLSSSPGPAVDFRFVDLSTGLGGQTRGLSAAWAFSNRLYLGFPDSGGNRPYFLSLLSPVPSPGLNAVVSTTPTALTDVLNLDGDRLPGLGENAGNSGAQLIDVMADFNDRLYVANNGGIVRSTTTTPRSPQAFPADWTTATPTAAAFTAKTSITSLKVSGFIPSDRAYPGIARFNGRLYAARNTTAGPQLWGCTPVGLVCPPASWALVAGNSTGDVGLTQFNDPANTSIGLLVATPTALFVGFNNASGIQVFKTGVTFPTVRSDFAGTTGCVAGVAGCAGLGSNGLGAPALTTQILDARALTFGTGSWLYLVAGNGTGAVRVWRFGG